LTEPVRLRIALVGLTHPFRGGIAHYTTLLCRELRRKHDVRFFALSRQYPGFLFPGKTQIDDSDASLQVPHEATIDSINPFTWISTAVKIARYKPDLIVYSWWHPFFAPAFGTIARLARWFGGARSCYICHNAIPHERSPIDRLLLRYVFATGDAFIAHSQQDADDLRRFRPKATVHQNPHPTYVIFAPDDAPSTDEAKRALGLTGKKVLLFFGFVREYKGLHYLLEAMEQLDSAEGYHLVVVGEFYDDDRKYRAALDRLERRGQLTLIDRYVPNEDVPGYFIAADLVMVPYLSATQSGVIQIAYGFLKPVVATTVGGIPEVVVDGSTGYLVPPGDAGALGRAARDYFESNREDEFRRGIDRENHKYSWDRMIETIERARSGLHD
jgi:glycosyltransferase involved in cell wall biosynthesis